MTTTYDKGDEVRVTGTVTNAAGTAVDPSVIRFKVLPPGEAQATYVYGTDAEVIRQATGIYYIDLDLNKSGEWRVRYESMGTAQAAGETSFLVAYTKFT